jgi:hypothetical protein
MATTEKQYIQVQLINGNKLTSKSNLAKVKWIEDRCHGYRFLSSKENRIPYAVYLTDQDYVFYLLRWM